MSAGPRVLVIGAGLAGSAVAAVLARRGRPVTLLAPAGDEDRTSAIPAGVLAPPVAPPQDPLTRIRRRGAACTRAWLALLERAGIASGRVGDGVAVVPVDARTRARHGRIRPGDPHVRPMPAGAAPSPLPAGSAWHALGACIRPPTLAAGLCRSAGPRLESVTGRAEALVPTDRGWAAVDAARTPLAEGTDVIVAAGTGSGGLLPAIRPLLHPARGQATAFSPADMPSGTPLPLSGGGYLTPAVDGLHWAGATLQRGDTDLAPRAADDVANQAFAQTRLGLPARPAALDRFVGIRATTPNRIPLVGACGDRLWVSAGHGAHGLATACLAAHLLADALAGRRHPWLRVTSPDQRRDRGHE